MTPLFSHNLFLATVANIKVRFDLNSIEINKKRNFIPTDIRKTLNRRFYLFFLYLIKIMARKLIYSFSTYCSTIRDELLEREVLGVNLSKFQF